MSLLFAMCTVAQARAQGNRYWWAWGLLALLTPFVGYDLWRLLGAKDNGTAATLLPRS